MGVENSQFKRLFRRADMTDKRIDFWPVFAGIYRRHRRRVGCVGGQPIDGFGGHGDNAARAQALGATGDIGVCRREHRHEITRYLPVCRCAWRVCAQVFWRFGTISRLIFLQAFWSGL